MTARVVHPCPCVACNGHATRRFASLAEEAHAYVRWYVLGCPNHGGPFPGTECRQLLIRYFPRSLSHTPGTWCWYAVLE